MIIRPGFNRLVLRAHGPLKLVSRLVPRHQISYSHRTLTDGIRPYDPLASFKSRRYESIDIDDIYKNLEVWTTNNKHRERILRSIQDGGFNEEPEHLLQLFNHLLDLSTIEMHNDEFLTFPYQIWHSVFQNFNKDSMTELQKLFLTRRNILVHITMNNQQHFVYKTIMQPLLTGPNAIKGEWCDVLADTIQFEYNHSKRQLDFNHKNIIDYLRDPQNSKKSKRVLISVFFRKGILYSMNHSKPVIIQNAIKFISMLEDDNYDLKDEEFGVYKTAFVELIRYLELESIPIEELQEWLESVNVSPDNFNILLSTFMKVLSTTVPLMTEKFWEFKSKSDSLGPTDLTAIMTSLSKTKKYNSILEVSKTNAELYHEGQLKLILKACEQLNDWKLMKLQFDDMYGRGQLPYVEHYSIIMNALIAVGGVKDIDRLYAQLIRRNITPTSGIFASLIRSKLLDNDILQANEILERYLEFTGEKKEASELFRLIFAHYLKGTDKDVVMQHFNQALQRQKEDGIALIDSRVILDLIGYLEECYGLKEIEHLKKLAEEMDLLNELVYSKILSAYVRLSQYQKAEALTFEAHHVALVPFTNSLLLSQQLRNYRFWFRDCNDRKTQEYILSRRSLIVDRVFGHNITEKGRNVLYTELIKFFLTRKQIGKALVMLTKAQTAVICTEETYYPFMKFYSESSELRLHKKCVAMYREIVGSNIKLTMKTYNCLLKSVLFLDKSNDVGFHNSDQLLRSIFELNDLTLPESLQRRMLGQEGEKEGRQYKADLSREAVALCRIVSSYLLTKPGSQTDKASFLLEFLSQLKSRLDDQMKLQLRVAIYAEMSNLYNNMGQLVMAESVIVNGINALDESITSFKSEYPYNDELVVPQSLRVNYRRLMGYRLKIMLTKRAPSMDFIKAFEDSERNHVHLRGNDYLLIVQRCIHYNKFKGLNTLMTICEEYLAANNHHEINLFRQLRYTYKLFLLDRSKVMSESRLQLIFKIYHEFYGITTLKQLERDIPNNEDTQKLIGRSLDILKQKYPNVNEWSSEVLATRPFIFFHPERQLTTSVKIPSTLSDMLIAYLATYGREDKTRLYELYAKFPSTMDVLLSHKPMKKRLEVFRRHINKVISPPEDRKESIPQRRQRTLRALARLYRRRNNL